MSENNGAKVLGKYIVADPRICHGKPTFRGTRIMVWQVLELLEEDMPWEELIENCHDRVSKAAIAEAIQLSREAFIRQSNELETEPAAA